MNDEHLFFQDAKHFFQEMRDWFRIEAQRHRDIMTSNMDVMNAIAAIPIAELSTSLVQMKTSVDTAVADMGTGGDAARAAMVTALEAVKIKFGNVATQIATIEAELTAAIAAQTPPPVTPVP